MLESLALGARRATPPPQAAPEAAATVCLHGRWLRPVWSLDGRRLRLELHDPLGLLPPQQASADLAWICGEDEMVARDADTAVALQRAGILRPPHAQLHVRGGSLPLARLSAAQLAQLAELLP